ncbi:MAG: ATP-dependent Clp protease ATP-binding subunit, partial [Clostridia bacterium]|nr:ATP-dependent Clp protease ATP-binding subunit [Clostridia bacterium]
ANAPAIDFAKLFGGMGASDSEGSAKDKKKSAKEEKKKEKARNYLENYCLNLSEKAKRGELDRIIGRDRELERVIQILNRRQKNNPCLIGEPGVGKTAIAEALAQRIAEKRVPYKLQNKEVYVLDLTALVAGTQFRGQFEGRMKGLIDEVKTLGNIILVIDEVHNLVGAGDAEGSMNAANILKPALSRSEIQVIGATTLAEYRKYIEKDSALERRFQPVIVSEPSISDTVDILKGIKTYYEQFHGLKISDEIVYRTVILSERYITDRFLPDKAIDLLDEAASHLAINTPVLSDIAQKTDALKETKAQREAIENSELPKEEDELNKRYEMLVRLKGEEIKLSSELDALKESADGVRLCIEDLARVIEIWTGIPAGNITENEFARIGSLKERLSARIIGQNEAISAVVRAIKRNRSGVSFKKKPVSFIFAGPTGVGKTELVKTLAADMFDSPDSLIRVDMSEYMEKHSVSRLIGSPPGYVGYDEAGQLTEKIRRRPYSVVLFDEIEKGHPDVLNIMLQILDDGRITDAQGREVNFENTIIVMTTNAGSNYVTAPAGFGKEQSTVGKEKTEKALSDFLRPEFLNRVDEIITFNSLTKENFKNIADIMLGELAKALSDRGIELKYTEEARNYIAEQSYSEKYGARNMRRYIEKNIEDEAANLIIDNYNSDIKALNIALSDGKLSVTIQ